MSYGPPKMMSYGPPPPKVIYVKVMKPKIKINPFKKIKAFFKMLIEKKKSKKEKEEECYGYDCPMEYYPEW